jgi:hypothetical protein
MPKRGGVTVKKIKIKDKSVNDAINDQSVLETMQNLMGTGKTQIDIIYKKVGDLQVKVKFCIKLLKKLFEPNTIISHHYPYYLELITNITKEFEEKYEELFTSMPNIDSTIQITDAEFDKYISQLNGKDELTSQEFEELKKNFKKKATLHWERLTEEQIESYSEAYLELKDNPLITYWIGVCSSLSNYKKYLKDHPNKNDLKDTFITMAHTNILDLLPEPLNTINFKEIYIDDRFDIGVRHFIMQILHGLYKASHIIYDLLTSPDIDIDNFIKIAMISIDHIQKLPELSRCNDAFRKIKNSINLLKENFSEYSKDFAISGNPAVIMENFVIDVAKNTHATPKVVMQFNKIISYYKKLVQQHANDNQQIKTIMKHIDRNFEKIQEAAGEMDSEAAGEMDSEAAGEMDSEAAGEMDSEARKLQEKWTRKLQEKWTRKLQEKM